jgi:hypothetical protein
VCLVTSAKIYFSSCRKEKRMNDKVSIETFHEWLNSGEKENPLLAILSKLTEVKDPSKISASKWSQPLGRWSGWSR